MEVQVLSRKKLILELQVKLGIPEGWKVISIRDVGDPILRDDSDNWLNVEFDDVIFGQKNCITIEQANQIRDFSIRAFSSGQNLIVSCNGGVSRSAAVAASIHRCLLSNTDERSIWFCSKFSPNEYVYKMMLESFHDHISDEELEKLVALSTKLNMLKA